VRHHRVQPQHYNIRVLKRTALLGALVLAAWSCSGLPGSAVVSPSPQFVTSTLPPTVVPSSTPVAPSSTPEPTPTPRAGITSTQLYVRSAPDSASQQLGLLPAATNIQVYGQDSSGGWYEIAYPQADQGTGWVAAQFVQVTGKDTLPVIHVPAAEGPRATVEQQVNVRGGPGTGFDSVGTLPPGAVVMPIGKDATGAWLQIHYPAGADTTGWVAAQYLQASDLGSLQVLDEAGGNSTPSPSTNEPTPIAASAPADGDSLASPAVQVVFSPAGTGAVIYTGDVSVPGGDSTDWIGFTPYSSSVQLKLSCTGNGQLSTTLFQRGQAVANWKGLACGKVSFQSLTPGAAYVLALNATSEAETPATVKYVVTIQGWQ
jgi:uncharacterized protein YraI